MTIQIRPGYSLDVHAKSQPDKELRTLMKNNAVCGRAQCSEFKGKGRIIVTLLKGGATWGTQVPCKSNDDMDNVLEDFLKQYA